MKRQADLPQVVLTLRSPRRFPSRLHGRKHQPDQDADDGNHDQQLDQRETTFGANSRTIYGWSFSHSLSIVVPKHRQPLDP
jgi:hypothetical protein